MIHDKINEFMKLTSMMLKTKLNFSCTNRLFRKIFVAYNTIHFFV